MRETYTVLCTYIKAVNIICFYIKFLYVSAHKRNSTARMCERVALNISIFRTRKGSLPYYNYIFFSSGATGLWPTERPPPVSEASANFCG